MSTHPSADSGATPTRDRVGTTYNRLRHLIVMGRIAPGSRIIETDVARRLGVSRTPVRSALQRLQQEGYVYSEDGGRQTRLVVAPLTRDDARELFALVGMIEGLGARLASMLPPNERDQLVAELRDVDQRLLAEFDADPPDTLAVFDLYTLFHRRYVEAGAGPRLLALHDSVKPQATRYRYLYSSTLVARIPDSVEEHGEIIRAIEAGDAERAEQAVRTNWANAAERLGRVIETTGERGSW